MLLSAPPIRRRGGSRRRRPARLAAVLSLVALGVLLAGCEVTATVDVAVEGRGGLVTVRFELDREALTVLGPGPAGEDAAQTLVSGADVRDLRRAGWRVAPPGRRGGEGDGALVAVSKRFERPVDLGRITSEIAGAEGPLSGFRLDRHRTLTGVDYRLTGGLDARAVTGAGNAEGLRRRLSEAGVDAEQVEDLLAARAADGFRLRVVASLPGRERANTTARAGGRPVWQVTGDERVSVAVSSSRSDFGRPALLVGAGLLLVAAVAVLRARAHRGGSFAGRFGRRSTIDRSGRRPS